MDEENDRMVTQTTRDRPTVSLQRTTLYLKKNKRDQQQTTQTMEQDNLPTNTSPTVTNKSLFLTTTFLKELS